MQTKRTPRRLWKGLAYLGLLLLAVWDWYLVGNYIRNHEVARAAGTAVVRPLPVGPWFASR